MRKRETEGKDPSIYIFEGFCAIEAVRF